MVQLLALYCLQLCAGTLGLGLALEDDGGAWKQKGEAGPVGPVSSRLVATVSWICMLVP